MIAFDVVIAVVPLLVLVSWRGLLLSMSLRASKLYERVVLFGLEKVKVARGDPGLIVIMPLADRAHQPDERMSQTGGVDVWPRLTVCGRPRVCSNHPRNRCHCHLARRPELPRSTRQEDPGTTGSPKRRAAFADGTDARSPSVALGVSDPPAGAA
ncbi:MAG: hypothetical protein ACLP01_20680 [Solirubrobacteraceae bacterium]